MMTPTERTVQSFGERLARMECRLVQLMLHLKLDPYEKTYEASYMKPEPKRRSHG